MGLWVVKSRLICYVFKARTQEILSQQRRDMCLYCGAGRLNAGQGMANCPDTDARREMTEKLNGQEGRVRKMHADCRDAAQSVTHLDVLARVVAIHKPAETRPTPPLHMGDAFILGRG